LARSNPSLFQFFYAVIFGGLLCLQPYCQKMRNQANMAVLLSTLVIFHNLTNGMAHNAPRAVIAGTTLQRSASV
jgi:hypothetical protein